MTLRDIMIDAGAIRPGAPADVAPLLNGMWPHRVTPHLPLDAAARRWIEIEQRTGQARWGQQPDDGIRRHPPARGTNGKRWQIGRRTT